GRQEEVERLALADEGRAVGGVLDQPTLVELERGLEHRLLVLVEAVEVLHRALADGDRGPGVLVVLALLRQHLLEIGVAHHERARQRLVILYFCRRRLDAGRGAAAGDRDRGGRGERWARSRACG